MKAMLVYTASSCGVSASGIRLTAPTVPWMVSSRVSPVNTRIVSCFSTGVRVPQDGMSLDTGTFSGSQKFPVSRSQTSASFSSCRRFQLIAETRSISFTPSVTRTPLHQHRYSTLRRSQTLPLGCDKATEHKKLCSRVAHEFVSDDRCHWNTRDQHRIHRKAALMYHLVHVYRRQYRDRRSGPVGVASI